MAVLAVGAILAAPVVVAATATAGAATATGGVAVAATATTSGSATGAAVAVGISMGPVGWMCLGCDIKTDGTEVLPNGNANPSYTLDCWKPVLHDESKEPSNGMLLKDVFTDSRIKNVTVLNDNAPFPDFILENIWDEQFRIEYLEVSAKPDKSEELCKITVAHAIRMNNN